MKKFTLIKSTLIAILLIVCMGKSFAAAGDAALTIDFTTKSTSNNSYTNTWVYNEQCSIYGAANNNGGWAYIRVGGKNTNPIFESTITLVDSIAVPVSQIDLTCAQVTSGSSFTMDSIVLIVSSVSDFSVVDDKVLINPALSMTAVPHGAANWNANSFYKLTFYWNSTTSSNRGMDLETITFKEGGNSTGNFIERPTITPDGGDVMDSVIVSMEMFGADTTIYYTVNGDDPKAAGTVLSTYTAPFILKTSATVKAITVAGTDTSAVAIETYTFPVTVATIAELRAADLSGVYHLTGEVVLSLKSATRGAKYIQDATGAILIDDNKTVITTTYNVGDGITGIFGTLNNYNGMLQFIPVQNTPAASSTNNTIVPVEVELANLANYQAQVVTVKNVTITGTGNFEKSNSYNLNGEDNPVLRTQYADLSIIGTAIPTTAVNITGVVLQYNTDRKSVV